MPNSEQLAQEFMSQGRPSASDMELGPMRPGDSAQPLFVKTPQFGQGFKEWAVSGYDLSGDSGVGTSDRSPETGKVADVKVNIPTPVRQARG